MDVSYLLWCSQAMLSRVSTNGVAVAELLEEADTELGILREKVARYELDFGGRNVGEMLKLMRKEKSPDRIPDVPVHVDSPKIAAELSRNKRSHQFGMNGTFDGEFELMINSTKGIIDGYKYFEARERGAEAESLFPRSSYEYIRNSLDFP